MPIKYKELGRVLVDAGDVVVFSMNDIIRLAEHLKVNEDVLIALYEGVVCQFDADGTYGVDRLVAVTEEGKTYPVVMIGGEPDKFLRFLGEREQTFHDFYENHPRRAEVSDGETFNRALFEEIAAEYRRKLLGEVTLSAKPIPAPPEAEQRVEAATFLAKRQSVTLTLEIANQYLANPDSMDLNRFEAIEVDAAKALSAHKGDLHLNGLKSLSDDAAIALAKHGRPFSIGSDCADELQLEGLESLSDLTAKVLCRREGHVSLNSEVLPSLSGDVAEILARHNDEWMQIRIAKFCQHSDGPVYYNWDRLDSVDAAEILARCSGGNLCLNNVTVLSADAAEQLARYQGECIYLNGLEVMSLDVARALTGFRGVVYLKGLPPLDVDEIPDECDELLELEWALAIRDPDFGYKYKLPTLHSESAAEALARTHFGEVLDLNAVKSLSPEAARAIAGGAGSAYLCLDGLKTLDVEVADALVHQHVHLSLNGLNKLPVDAAKALARCSMVSDRVSTEWGMLSLNGLESLPVEVAAALVGHGNNQSNFRWELLSLDRLTENDLSAEVARTLVWRNEGCPSICEYLSLNGLKSLTDEVAQALAGHVGGKLSLNGLTKVSDTAADALGRHKGRVSLDSLSHALHRAMLGEPQTTISKEAAASLLRVWEPTIE
jgi:hypothetical protein